MCALASETPLDSKHCALDAAVTRIRHGLPLAARKRPRVPEPAIGGRFSREKIRDPSASNRLLKGVIGHAVADIYQPVNMQSEKVCVASFRRS